MVDLTLTDEQKDLRELAHNFAEKEIRSVAWDYDRDATWPQEIIEKAHEVGLMNTHAGRTSPVVGRQDRALPAPSRSFHPFMIDRLWVGC